MDVVREEEIDVVGGGPEVPSTVEEYMEWVPVASGNYFFLPYSYF